MCPRMTPHSRACGNTHQTQLVRGRPPDERSIGGYVIGVGGPGGERGKSVGAYN